jgi:hypothetical protein
MALSSCGPQSVTDGWCPQTIDDVMSDIYGLLPPGPAWAAAQVPGTLSYKFWRAIGNAVLWVYSVLCAYVPEFFCNTAKQSVDQWNTEYGIGADPCDAYGYDLCAKVTAIGGQTCADFTALALANGWVIDCQPTYADSTIGCLQIGALQVGPPAVPVSDFNGKEYLTDDLGAFEVGNSQLGPPPEPSTACFQAPTFPAYALDRNGNFVSWGNFYAWSVTVHVAESFALQGASRPANVSSVGTFQVGCSPIDGAAALPLCFLQEIAPAHTVLTLNIAQ